MPLCTEASDQAPETSTLQRKILVFHFVPFLPLCLTPAFTPRQADRIPLEGWRFLFQGGAVVGLAVVLQNVLFGPARRGALGSAPAAARVTAGAQSEIVARWLPATGKRKQHHK